METTHEQLLRLKEVFTDSITRPWQVSVSIDRHASTIQIICRDVDGQDIDYICDQGDRPAQPATEPPAPADLSHLSDEQFNALAPQGYHGVGDCLPVPEGPTDEELLITYQHAVSNQVEIIIQSTGTYAGMDDLAAATLAGLHAVLARFGRPAIERTRPQPEGPKVVTSLPPPHP